MEAVVSPPQKHKSFTAAHDSTVEEVLPSECHGGFVLFSWGSFLCGDSNTKNGNVIEDCRKVANAILNQISGVT